MTDLSHPEVPASPTGPFPASPFARQGTDGAAGGGGPPVPLAGDALRSLVALAIRAPSLHNSQPWRFRPAPDDPGALDVLVDPARALPATDPTGWAARLACGAAAFNVRVGFALWGWETVVHPLPDRSCPEALLRVSPVRRQPPTPLARALAAAVPLRHSNRRPYRDQRVPPHELSLAAAAAREEGGWLTVLSPAAVAEAGRMISAAAQTLARRPGYLDELVHCRHAGPDGVPPDPLVGPPDPTEPLPRRHVGVQEQDRPSPGAPDRPGGERVGARSLTYESDPVVLVLGTYGGSVFDDLHAGQALQRVLLTLTDLRLATSMYSQPIEVPSIRFHLASLAGHAHGTPQMLLRVGYALPHGPTARRPIEDVLAG